MFHHNRTWKPGLFKISGYPEFFFAASNLSGDYRYQSSLRPGVMVDDSNLNIYR